MKVCYDKLWKLLIDKKMKRTDLIRRAGISSNVLARMGRSRSLWRASVNYVLCSAAVWTIFWNLNRQIHPPVPVESETKNEIFRQQRIHLN